MEDEEESGKSGTITSLRPFDLSKIHLNTLTLMFFLSLQFWERFLNRHFIVFLLISATYISGGEMCVHEQENKICRDEVRDFDISAQYILRPSLGNYFRL